MGHKKRSKGQQPQDVAGDILRFLNDRDNGNVDLPTAAMGCVMAAYSILRDMGCSRAVAVKLIKNAPGGFVEPRKGK